MERLNNIHKQDLVATDFDLFPIWVWDDEQEGYHPLSGGGAFPEQFGTMFIKSIFKTAGGIEVEGYLVGIQTFYAFCLFVGGQEYLINLNALDLVQSELKTLESVLKGPLFPLQYRADIGFDGHPQIVGTFNK